MLTSELIALLEKIQAKKGDIEIVCYDKNNKKTYDPFINYSLRKKENYIDFDCYSIADDDD